jgi:hypothetical protein
MGAYSRRPQTPIATPTGANGTVLIYDDAFTRHDLQSTAKDVVWITVACYLTQACTLVHKWAPRSDSPDTALQNISSADTSFNVSANSFFQKSVRLRPGRNQISFAVGATPPAANWLAVEIEHYPGLR